MLVIAKLIGPAEMGKSITSLLYITYSAYLSLGLNSVIVKNFKILKNKNEQINFLTINFQLLTLLSCLNFFITYYIFSIEFFFLISIISIGTLFRSFFSSYFRVIDKTYVLNINNILLSLLLIFATLLFVNNWNDYLYVWALVILTNLLSYFLFDLKTFSLVLKKSFSIPKKSIIIINTQEGLRLSLLAVLSTIYLSADRLIINNMDISNDLKGSNQLADNFSTAIFIGVSALIFYFTPNWINNIKNDFSYSNNLFKIANFSFFIVPVLSFITFLIGYIVELYWFTEYVSLSNFVFISTFLKLLILFSGIESLIFIALDKEIKYFKINIPSLFLVVLTFIYFNFYETDQNKILLVPVILSLIIVILLFVQRIFIKKILKL